MTKIATWIRGRVAAGRIVRWAALAVLTSFAAFAVLGQSQPPKPEHKQTKPEPEQAKPEKVTPQQFHSTVVIIVDAPKEAKQEIAAAMARAFGEIRDTSVYVYSGEFKRPPDWTISVSANVTADKDDSHFVMGIAFSRAQGLVDPTALMDAMQNKIEIPTATVTQLLKRGYRSVSNFKALWVAQGSMKTDLAGVASRAAALFDHNLLSKDRELFQRTPPIERKKRPNLPDGVPFPH